MNSKKTELERWAAEINGAIDQLERLLGEFEAKYSQFKAHEGGRAAAIVGIARRAFERCAISGAKNELEEIRPLLIQAIENLKQLLRTLDEGK